MPRSQERVVDRENDSSTPRATLNLFGYDPTHADLRLTARDVGWRLRRTFRIVLFTALVTPIFFLIPPHAPWGLGALGIGLFLARRRWLERYTIEGFEGVCPKCGAPLRLPTGVRLKEPHPVTCSSCRHDSTLVAELPPSA